jgi:hypothetical protein
VLGHVVSGQVAVVYRIKIDDAKHVAAGRRRNADRAIGTVMRAAGIGGRGVGDPQERRFYARFGPSGNARRGAVEQHHRLAVGLVARDDTTYFAPHRHHLSVCFCRIQATHI